MTEIHWPVLWVEQDEGMAQIGAPDLEWKGQPLDLPTMDDYTIEMGKGLITSVTIRIPVIVRVRPREAA